MRRVAWVATMAVLGYLVVRAAMGGCAGTLPKPGTVAPAWQARDALDVAFSVEHNTFNGRSSVELSLTDVRSSSGNRP